MQKHSLEEVLFLLQANQRVGANRRRPCIGRGTGGAFTSIILRICSNHQPASGMRRRFRGVTARIVLRSNSSSICSFVLLYMFFSLVLCSNSGEDPLTNGWTFTVLVEFIFDHKLRSARKFTGNNECRNQARPSLMSPHHQW